MTAMRTRAAVPVLAAASAAYCFVWLRKRLLTWGATPAEVSGRLPGDDLLADAGGPAPSAPASTMATTIAAPPKRVWPWLAQMGCDRAGWYSWDRLDNAGRPSTTRIHPEWQTITAGDRLASAPGGATWFEVAEAQAPTTLVLRATVDLRTRRSIPSDGPRPTRFTDSTWAFLLQPLPGERTRLIVRGRGTGAPHWLIAATNGVFWDPAHVIMQVRQLRNLRRRAERAGQISPSGGPASRSPGSGAVARTGSTRAAPGS